MTITKIERQKKNRTRLSVFIDDRYAFSVSEEVYGRFVLHSGQDLSDEERKAIEDAEASSSVKRTALRYRSFRPRSVHEIETYLHKKGFDVPHIELAMQFLSDQHLLDDAELARMVCRDKLLLKPIGRQTMKQLLMKKGIDRGIVERVLAEQYTEESERALALREGERKFKRVSALPAMAQRKRIYEHLLRRGYEHSLALKITTQLVKQ